MSDSLQREQAIFDPVLALPSPERAAYLQRDTLGDPALRQRVEALLGGYEVGDFLEQGARRDKRVRSDSALEADIQVR